MAGKDNQVIVELLLANNRYLDGLVKAQKHTRDFSSTAKKSAETANASFSSLKKVVAAVGVGLLVREMKQFAVEAGKFSTIKRAFENLTSSYGTNSERLVASMQEASKGTMSMQDSMESATNAIQLMGENVIEMLPRMTEIATSAARASGVEVSTMMNDLVKASGRQSVMILDNLGISSVTAGKKMEEYAAKLGKTRLQLTESEKAAAFFYAVTEAGGEIVDRVGDKTLTLGEEMQRLNARTKDLVDKLHSDAIPGLTVLTKSLSDAATKGGFLQKAMDKIGYATNYMYAKIAYWVTQIDWYLGESKDKYEENMKTYERNVEYAKSHLKILKEQYGLTAKQALSSGNTKAVMHAKEYYAAVASGKKRMEDVQSIHQQYENSIRDIARALDEAAKNQKNFNGSATIKGGGNAGGSGGKKSEEGDPPWVKSMNKYSGIAGQFISNIQSMTSSLGEYFAQAASQQMSYLDTMKSGISAYFNYAEERALESAGVQEKTRVQSVEAEISDLQKQMRKTANLSKRKALQEQISQKNDEKKKLKIQEEFDEKRKNAEMLMDIWKMMLARRQFYRQQQMQYATTSIQMASGIMQAMVGGISTIPVPIFAGIALGAAMAAVVAAIGGVQLGMIASQSPPAFATGSWDVQHTGPAILHGGEIVTPKPIADSIRSGEAYLGSGSGGGGDIVMVMDGRQVGRVVRERNSRFARSIGARIYSMAGAY